MLERWHVFRKTCRYANAKRPTFQHANNKPPYLAAQIRHLMTAPLLLDPVFNFGESIGPILAYTMALLMAIELGYVFVKYVITSNK